MAGRIAQENEVDNVFSISNRAAKFLDHEVFSIAKENINMGKSKKDEHEKIKVANGGTITAHQRGQGTGFHSWETYHKYTGEFQKFAHYCRSEFGVKSISDIKPQMATLFCRELGDLNYSKNTVNSYCSAIEKFGSFLKIDFHSELQQYKKTDDYKGLEAKDTNTRTYDKPQNIIDSIGNEKVQFAAQLSLNYGLRIGDACHFKLNGNKIEYNSKNGMKTVKTLTPQDAARAATFVDSKGKFNISTNTAKDCWAKACAAARVENTGWHGLRHNYAQSRYNELTGQGLSHKEACLIISHEMNHSRPEITETYLR